MTENIIEQIEQPVNEAVLRENFNIVEVIRGRSYPKIKLEAYLDEEAAFEALRANEQLEESIIADGSGEVSENTKRLESLFKEALSVLESSKVIVTISGISEGDREDIMEKVLESYPLEHEETKNPLTGMVTKTEVESKDRDKLFTNLLWQAQIKSMQMPDGRTQGEFSLEDIANLRRTLPVATLAAINDAIEKVRVSTAVFMSKVNEDFLAKR